MAEISRDEFQATIDRLYTVIATGFEGVHDRLDQLNGRTRTNEVGIDRLGLRVSLMEKDVADHPRRRSGDFDHPSLLARLPDKVIWALLLVGLAGISESVQHLLPDLVRLLLGAR